MVNLHFFQVPPYHELYKVEHWITAYLRLARSTDGCNPIMSHGSSGLQAGIKRILFIESILLCMHRRSA